MRNSKSTVLCMVLLLFAFVTLVSFNGVKADNNKTSKPLSPTAFVIDSIHNYLVVVQKTGLSIDFFDLKTSTLIKRIPSTLPPTGICYNGNDKIYVSCSYALGEIMEVDIDQLKVVRTWAAGHGAISPVISPDGTQLFVANQHTNDITVFDLSTTKELSRIKVQRQPMTMDITPDGRWLYVANFLPATRADIDTVAADVSIIDTKTKKIQKHIKLTNGSNALRGLKVTPDGKYVLIAHNLGRFQVPTTQLEQGWMNTSALSVLDVEQQNNYATILLDEPERGAAGSWGVDANNSYIAVAHSGTHDYSLIHYQQMLDKLNTIEDKEILSYDLSFLGDIRQRYKVEGNGPRHIKLSNNKVYAALYFSDCIHVADLGNHQLKHTIEMNPGLQIDSVRLGEIVFNDASHCFQQWQSCNGCHPNDARTDGLNWDLLNDGIGNPKNCKSMLLAHETPPAMVTGIRPTAKVAVRAGFRHIQFAQVDEADARAVDKYLLSLKPVPSPYLVDGQLSEKAQKGQLVFKQAGCAYCHPAPYYTDEKKHDIGTPGKSDRTSLWDTPTLIEVWRTAPYLHDGRSASILDMLKEEKHGLKKELSDIELEQLAEYVLSL